MSVVRLILAMALLGCGWVGAGRLQEWPHAVLVASDNQRYEGRVSRELISGDYIVDVAPDRQIHVPASNLGVMSWDSKAQPITRSSATMFLVCMLLGLVLLWPIFFHRK